MIRTIAACLLTVATAQAAVIVSFDATSGAPNTQGFGQPGGVTSGASVTDLGQTAWQMTGNNCCGYWFRNLTNQQWTDAFTRGWSLSGVVRTTGTTGGGYLFLDTTAAFNRFDISFGNDGTNGWAGLSNFTDFANPALKTTFTGNDYHLLDMRWDPTTQSASLFVDGILALSGYTGHSQFRESHGPAFGVSGFTTNLFIQSLQFSITDPVVIPPPGGGTGGSGGDVPEPSTCVMVGAGLLAVLSQRELAK